MNLESGYNRAEYGFPPDMAMVHANLPSRLVIGGGLGGVTDMCNYRTV